MFSKRNSTREPPAKRQYFCDADILEVKKEGNNIYIITTYEKNGCDFYGAASFYVEKMHKAYLKALNIETDQFIESEYNNVKIEVIKDEVTLKSLIKISGKNIKIVIRCEEFIIELFEEYGHKGEEWLLKHSYCPENEDVFKQIESLIDQKNFTDAQKLFEQLKNHRYVAQKYYVLRSRLLRNQGKLDEAKIFCLRAIADFPLNAELNSEMGYIFRELKNWHEAIKYFEEAIKYSIGGKFSLNNAIWHNGLGLAYRYSGDTKNALKNYNLAFESLALDVYIKVKYGERIINYDLLKDKSKLNKDELWVKLAISVIEKDAKNDNIKSILYPTVETAEKKMKDGKNLEIYEDDGDKRYVNPEYFPAFFTALHSSSLYNLILSNAAETYAFMGDFKKANDYLNQRHNLPH